MVLHSLRKTRNEIYRVRRLHNRKIQGVIWAIAIVFPIAFGYRTTVDAGVFMAIVSLLVALVVSQVLLADVKVRAQGGREDAINSDLASDEIS